MTEDTGTEAERVTDRERIRRLAAANGAVPVYADSTDLRLVTDPDGADGTRVEWNQFFEQLERTGRVVRYRPPDPATGRTATFEIVGRESADAGRGAAGGTDESAGVEGDQIATGDTGDAEPIAFDRTAGDRFDPADGSVSESGTGDSASARLVLDEIRTGTSAPGSELEDEYLVFLNEGEERIDLSEWTVDDDAGHTFRFPPDTGLNPGERLTLHSGSGEDTRGHLYWGIGTSIWENRQATVIVRNANGDRVL